MPLSRAERIWKRYVLNSSFLNLSIIHQVKTKKITTVNEVWTPSLNKHRFLTILILRLLLSFFRLRRYIKHSRQCFIGIQTKTISTKTLRCASYFQLSSRCLDFLMKHCHSCLIYYIKFVTKIK